MTNDRASHLAAVWSLATFHTVAFVLVPVLFLYSRGALTGVLSGLNTLVGFALFLALWATTRFATRRAVESSSRSVSGALEDESGFVRHAARWGGANGVLFLAVLSVAVLAGVIATSVSAGASVLASLGFGLAVAPFALIIAFAVGGVSGFILGSVDLALLALARVIVARCVTAGTEAVAQSQESKNS